MKKSHLIGSAILSIVLLLAVLVVLMLTGVFDTKQEKLVFVSQSADKYYDGESLTCDKWELISGNLMEGDRVVATILGTQTEAGISDNIMTVSIFNEKDKDVTDRYDIECKYGTLTVNKAIVKINADSATKQYDGKELKCDTYTIVSGSLASGHKLQVDVIGSRTDVGETVNTITATAVDNAGNDVSYNYQFICVEGEIEVTPNFITIQSGSAEKIYDGTVLENPETNIIFGELAEGHTMEIVVTGSQTNVGKSSNGFGVEILDAEGNSVTNNYAITTIYGDLEITPKYITVQSESEVKTYDGTPLVNEGITITSGELVEGQTMEVSVTGSQTDVGLSENVFGIQFLDAEGNDVTDNYSITTFYGELEVTPKYITVQSNSATKTYDSLPLTSDEVSIISGEIVEGQILEISATGTQTDAGNSDNVFGLEIFDAEGNDVTSNYSITKFYGVLEVLPIYLTVATDSASKTYDGLPLIADGWNLVSDTTPLANHLLEVSVLGEITNAGKVENSITEIRITDENGNNVKHNYSITRLCGELEVLPIKLSVSTESATKVYDGLPLIARDWELTSTTTPLDSHTLEVVVIGEITNAGSVKNAIGEIIITNENGENVASNYEVTTFIGTLEVTQRQITIKTESASKVYDRTPLIERGWEITSDTTLVDGHTIELSVVGELTNVGEIYNSITELKIYDEEGKNVTRNYNVSKNHGKLKVLPIEISITTESATKVYDGLPLIAREWRITSDTIPLDGHTLDVIVIGEITDAGTVPNSIGEVIIVDENGENVTSCYDISKFIGTLKVTQRTFQVRTPSASKVYDGTPLTAEEYEIVSGDTLVDGHTLQIDVVGEITEVGSVQNSIGGIIITDQDGKNVSANYDVSTIIGRLSVTSRIITIKTESASKVYDKLPLIARDWEIISETQIADGQTINVAIVGEITNVSRVKNAITELVISDANGNDVTNNYSVEQIIGDLEILPIQLSVSTASASKVYDGLPLTANEWQLESETTPLDGHTLEVVVVGEITNVGSIYNAIGEIIITDENDVNVTSNYDISTIQGRLEVTSRNLTIKTKSASKVYDALPLILREYEISSETTVANNHRLSVEIIGEITNVGSVKNAIGEIIITDENGENVTSNYNISTVIGSLEVTKRTLTIRTGSASKEYDGTPLVCDEWSIVSQTAQVDGHTITVIISGERTEVGESPNYIAEIKVLDENGIDVTNNYNLSRSQEGVLIVFDTDEPDDDDDPSGGGGGGGEDDDAPIGPGLSESGSLSDNGAKLEDLKKIVLASIYSTKTGSIYLRSRSYGNYNGKGWSNEVTEYTEKFSGIYSANYLTGLVLKEAKYESDAIKIKLMCSSYMLPYYLEPTKYNYDLPTNDVTMRGDVTKTYSAYYYGYGYLYLEDLDQVPAEYREYERKYREFVYENYLDVPASTLPYVDAIIELNGFDKNDPEVILEVATYVKSCATYNFDYDKALDKESDIVAAFLTKYKEGVCRHYASAGTLIFRALGIPARYTTGCMDATEEGEWVDVTADRAHAWVEVYMDGIGWVVVEVTGGTGDDGGDGGGGGGGGNDNEDDNEDDEDEEEKEKHVITVEPSLQEYMYNGQMHYADSNGRVKLDDKSKKMIEELGYTYTYTLSGSRKEVGYGAIQVHNFRVFDSAGFDITRQFVIDAKDGKLHVYEKEIFISSNSYVKEYDGIALVPDPNGFTNTSLIDDSHRIIVTFRQTFTNVQTKDNSFKAVIVDENGEDVSVRYKIMCNYGTLSITPKVIQITAGSATKTYDGTELTCNTWEITEGEICGDHRAIVTVVGSQTDIGRCDNAIIDVQIINKQSEDVTSNYSIEFINGRLTVMPDTN